MMPDMIREITVMAFISAFMRIYPARITQSIAMKPNCVGENVRLAIMVTVSMWVHKDNKKWRRFTSSPFTKTHGELMKN